MITLPFEHLNCFVSSFGLTVWSLINGYDDDSVSKPVIEILNKLHNAL